MLPFSCPAIGNLIWIEPLLKGYLSYKATFSLSQIWPLNTGLTVYLINNMSAEGLLQVIGNIKRNLSDLYNLPLL